MLRGMSRCPLWMTWLLACASSAAPGPASPQPVAGRADPAAQAAQRGAVDDGARVGPGAGPRDGPREADPQVAAPAGERAPSEWRFGARDLVAIESVGGGAASTLQSLDREHTLEVFSMAYEFGQNERDVIETFRSQDGARCDVAQGLQLRGRRAFYARCLVRDTRDGGARDHIEHGMALSTGRTLLLVECRAQHRERDECASMLQTFWLPEPAPEKFRVVFGRPLRVGQRFTMHTGLTRALKVARTGPDHKTRHHTRKYEAQLEFLGEVLSLDAEGGPGRVRFTVQAADAQVDGQDVAIAAGTRVLLDRAARPQTAIESRRVPKLAAEVLESALGATAYFPLSEARYGSPEPQPLDGSWSGPAEVQAAGGDAYSKLIAVAACPSGKCLEVETETFMPGLISMPFAEGTGSEAARILLRAHYPLDGTAQPPRFSLLLAQQSQGILTELGRAYMIDAGTRVRIDTRLVWHVP